jgi:DNA-binding NtrC family response regulator
VQHFLEKYNGRLHKQVQGISPEALELLMKQEWPGNVRELENTVERLVVLSSGPYIEPTDLAYGGIFRASFRETSSLALRDLERDHILRILQRFDGRISDTARALGIDRKTLREKLKRYNFSDNPE